LQKYGNEVGSHSALGYPPPVEYANRAA
jgi:hypothetical protein